MDQGSLVLDPPLPCPLGDGGAGDPRNLGTGSQAARSVRLHGLDNLGFGEDSPSYGTAEVPVVLTVAGNANLAAATIVGVAILTMRDSDLAASSTILPPLPPCSVFP